MDLREAMKARHMVRKYLDKSMPEDIVQKLNTRVKENNEKYGVAVELRINDTSAFNSLIKLILAKGVQNFFVLQGNDTPELDENLGKCGADIMLYAQTLGLNTWWVGGTFNRGKLNEKSNGNKVIGVIAVGYGATQGVPHKSKTYEDVASYTGETPAWFIDGVNAALLAPTALNKQEFTIKGVGSKVVITANKESIFSGADIGLVKYHFELGAWKENFNWDE